MGKQEVLSSNKAIYLAAQDANLDALGGADYDGGFADGVASVPPSEGGGGFSQEQMDAFAAQKVQEALAADQVGDDANMAQAQAEKAQAIADGLAALQADHAAMQVQLDEAKSSGQMSADQVKGIQDKYDALQAILSSFKALMDSVLNPPAPPPADVPPPVDDSQAQQG